MPFRETARSGGVEGRWWRGQACRGWNATRSSAPAGHWRRALHEPRRPPLFQAGENQRAGGVADAYDASQQQPVSHVGLSCRGRPLVKRATSRLGSRARRTRLRVKRPPPKPRASVRTWAALPRRPASPDTPPSRPSARDAFRTSHRVGMPPRPLTGWRVQGPVR